jgi:competence ComEA-like helix-hairpin-helix protein
MKESWRDTFYLTYQERQSALVIGCVCLFFYLSTTFYPYLFADKNQYEFPPLPTLRTSHAETETVKEQQEQKTVSLFPFNPNTATREDFSNLGLSEKLINTILKMRNRGWKFYKPADFQKIWGLSPTEFSRLEPYISIESYKNAYEKQKTDAAIVELGEPFSFSPNLASIDDLLRLGIPKNIAQRIINYRNTGAVFKSKTDLMKMYGFPQDLYLKLEPYILIDEKVVVANTSNITNNVASGGQNHSGTGNYNIPNQMPQVYDNTQRISKKSSFNGSIDINQANHEQFQQLPGIGAGYANKIVNFREKLGGFYSIEQIKETYGLPDSTFQKIRPFLKASSVTRTININTVTVEELGKHPYFKFYHAKALIAYRDMHGKFANAEAIKKVNSIQDILPKILPYLSY